MHSPRDYLLRKVSPELKHLSNPHRRVSSVYHRDIANSINPTNKKPSPQKMNKVMSLDTQADIVDQIKNYDNKHKQTKNNLSLNLESLFYRNQSSMSELMRIREVLMKININKQLEKLK